jgi:hypothetical protein
VAGAATEYQAVGASWDAQYADNASAAGVALTMYQDSAGTTAVSSPDQPTGLLVDLAQGMSAGSELITNGTFDTDTTGWTARQNATLSSVSGRLRITFNGTSYPEASQGITTVVGGVYTLSIDVVSSTATSCWVQLGTTAGGSQILNLQLAVGDNTTRKFVATSTTTYIGLYTVSTSGQYMDADNVSIKQVMGYHAIQSGASALRPALRLNSNGKWWIQRDLIDDAMVTTFPNLGANCVSYINDGTAVTETTGVTLNGALTQSTPGADYGRVYLGATSSKSAQIIKWLKAKAGL